MALRQVRELGSGALVIREQVIVPKAENAFDDMDNLKDARQATAKPWSWLANGEHFLMDNET